MNNKLNLQYNRRKYKESEIKKFNLDLKVRQGSIMIDNKDEKERFNFVGKRKVKKYFNKQKLNYINNSDNIRKFYKYRNKMRKNFFLKDRKKYLLIQNLFFLTKLHWDYLTFRFNLYSKKDFRVLTDSLIFIKKKLFSGGRGYSAQLRLMFNKLNIRKVFFNKLLDYKMSPYLFSSLNRKKRLERKIQQKYNFIHRIAFWSRFLNFIKLKTFLKKKREKKYEHDTYKQEHYENIQRYIKKYLVVIKIYNKMWNKLLKCDYINNLFYIKCFIFYQKVFEHSNEFFKFGGDSRALLLSSDVRIPAQQKYNKEFDKLICRYDRLRDKKPSFTESYFLLGKELAINKAIYDYWFVKAVKFYVSIYRFSIRSLFFQEAIFKCEFDFLFKKLFSSSIEYLIITGFLNVDIMFILKLKKRLFLLLHFHLRKFRQEYNIDLYYFSSEIRAYRLEQDSPDVVLELNRKVYESSITIRTFIMNIWLQSLKKVLTVLKRVSKKNFIDNGSKYLLLDKVFYDLLFDIFFIPNSYEYFYDKNLINFSTNTNQIRSVKNLYKVTNNQVSFSLKRHDQQNYLNNNERICRYWLFIKPTLNNLFSYVYDFQSSHNFYNLRVIQRKYINIKFISVSLGLCGYKGPAKNGSIAFESAGYLLSCKLKKAGILKVTLILTSKLNRKIKDFLRGLITRGKIQISYIYIFPCIAHNGCRVKKKRRA